MDWGSKIRELRFAEGLKQDALALEFGVSQAAISQWERGLSDPPLPIQDEILKRTRLAPNVQMAEALCCSVRHSPHPACLAEFVNGEFLLRICNDAALRDYPLLSITDLDQPLEGKLGQDVDCNMHRFVEAGGFEDRLRCVRVTSRPQRDGRSLFTQSTYTPFKVARDRWLVRADIKILAHDDRRIEFAPAFEIDEL
ncbi:helix-turn-helix transcriptional regulator [Maricaulis sp.]|uniref:helix-turn-helix domain-containing protein n=1 Tax=Maricaulis sp. TaxID=1486257 RepID=UPI00261785F4|nr:helix-turn-helix transcriptional regulator [Maricaulis sp.]